jgi:curli biogenesis system outer membrane secretion channel CsgG
MPAHKGVKHAIGVSDFTNQVGYHAWSTLGGNLKFMLESALAESGRFVMVERINLGTVIAEQDLQKSGRAAEAKSVAETGKLRSAKYVATGAVTEISESTSGENGGFGIGGIRVGGSSSKSTVVLVVKLIDSTTGEQVASKRVRGEAGKSGLSIGINRGGGSGNLGAFAKTPLGEAAQDCINEAVKFIAESMQKTDIESMVVAVTKDEVVIGMGENYGVAVGQKLIVRKDGEVLKDPDSGAILDRLEGETTGSLEIVRVREKTAYCKLLDGTMPVRGDRVVVK